ncbi:SDR family NAD(P)-dependent oxidoreductase [Lentzea sp. DG1S-22]|uniref:SDR family NAD(P)-dependent oxidoreductase n=1 Tax=Lentzea sp. DG1S-22 TaxID=3108822 RepID=UPI002E75C0DA|nr:SDR family NAD(P)-dependent oxidoreductase [Lentzea sp. DG1S-22]WVH82367.1 SDR family NAD(P)-dependent oxidoreductase [Lentzea sp. DG1S-22]
MSEPTSVTGAGEEGLARFVFTGCQPVCGKPALVDLSRPGAARRWSRSELIASVASLAEGLRSSGLAAGDVVAILVTNSAEFVIAYHGVLAAGGVVLVLDPRAGEQEWNSDLAQCPAVAIIVESELGYRPPPPVPTVVRIGGVALDDEIPWSRFTPPDRSGRTDLLPIAGGARPAVLMSSSGTQGRPKKIVVTHHNLAAGLVQIEQVHRLSPSDTVTSAGPLRHIYGMQMAMNAALRAGASLVIGPTRFDREAFLELLAEHEVTVAYVVPSVLAEVAALEPPSSHALRLVVSGGAPLPTAVAVKCEEALHVPVVQGFGMTEAGCVSFTPDEGERSVGAVGVVLPGTDARFVDPASGSDAPQGQPGELWLRGPQITPGYLEGGRITGVHDDDGWFRTGDLAVLGQGGQLHITGRIKSLIKYKGHQVSPAELEDVLMSHPGVHDAFVAGQPDSAAGELPKAYVVTDRATSLEDVRAHVAAHVPSHKRVRVLERVREIPRSNTGKSVRPPALRVFVTGGGRGLGREFSRSVVAAGGSVLAVGRDHAALASTAAAVADLPGQFQFRLADLRNAAAVETAVRTGEQVLGGIDVLVNNAGIAGPLGPAWQVDAEKWRAVFDINLIAAHQAIHSALPAMTERGFGRLINIVSRAGLVGWPGASAYAVSKAALIALTANLYGELRETGVSVIAFDPGLVDIGITRAHLDRGRVGDPFSDRVLDFALRKRENGGFTPLVDAVAAFSSVVMGGADQHSGEYVTVTDVLGAC